MPHRLTALPGDSKKNDLKAAIRQIRAGLADQIELTGLIAKVQRAKYLALIAEGFTPAEALELCRTV